MYSAIVCGFEAEEIYSEVDRLLACKHLNECDVTVTCIYDGIFMTDNLICHIKTGKDIGLAYILKGEADELIAATFESAVRNMNWLKHKGKVKIYEQYDDSKKELHEYIIKCCGEMEYS